MKQRTKKDIVHKERLTHILRLLLEIAGHDTRYSKNPDVDYMKRLKFQKLTDWKKYRASTDLFDDTEYAIINAFKYQLGQLSKRNDDIGEMYLRLYGILNAVYLQIGALNTIANLLNFPQTQLVMMEFRALPIYKLRNMAGAHTVDYTYEAKEAQEKGINQKSSFRIIQCRLNKSGENIQALDENNLWHKFNLLDILIEYERKALDFLVQLIRHMITTLIYEKDQKEELKERLDNMLPNLIDYGKLNINKKYEKRLMKNLQKTIDELKKKRKGEPSIEELLSGKNIHLEFEYFFPKPPAI